MTVPTPAERAAFHLTTVLPVRTVKARERGRGTKHVGSNGIRTQALRAKLKALEKQGLNRKQIMAAADVSHVTVRNHLGKVKR